MRLGANMKQLKMFAPCSERCMLCGVFFVPLSKDIIRSWEDDFHREADWLAPQGWAVDRIYRENLKYCSPACVDKAEENARARLVEKAWERASRKYR